MAFKKTLVQRLFNLSRFSTAGKTHLHDAKPTRTAPKPIRVNHIHQSASSPQSSPAAMMRLFPITQSCALSETLRDMTLDGLVAYPKHASREKEEGLTVSEVRKVLRATQAEMIRDKLRNVGRDWVTYKEFFGLIEEFCGGNKEQALLFAKTLDDSGSVIVFGSCVCLRPHQEIRTLVAKAIHSLVSPVSADPNDPKRKELELMEVKKAEIDQKAESLVRRELWAGLGYMVVQTAVFMRLTFWELSWDVMEPICCYVTSAYFMLGYTFFLRTSKEPSFEGFFKSRFNAKQKRLMKSCEFDLKRYNELRKELYPQSLSSSPLLDDTRMIKFDHYHKAS